MANSRTAWNKAYASGRMQWRGSQRLELDIREGSRVLEVGCGNGKTLVPLISKKLDLYAVDFSSAAVENAKEFVKLTGKKCEVSVQDVCDLQFADSFFDYALCIHVLGHLTRQQQEKAVSEMSRVLRPGGRLYVRAFTVNDFRRGKGEEREPDTFVRKGIATHYFTEAELRALIGDWLRIEKCEPDKWTVRYDGKDYGREELNVVAVREKTAKKNF